MSVGHYADGYLVFLAKGPGIQETFGCLSYEGEVCGDYLKAYPQILFGVSANVSRFSESLQLCFEAVQATFNARCRSAYAAIDPLFKIFQGTEIQGGNSARDKACAVNAFQCTQIKFLALPLYGLAEFVTSVYPSFSLNADPLRKRHQRDHLDTYVLSLVRLGLPALPTHHTDRENSRSSSCPAASGCDPLPEAIGCIRRAPSLRVCRDIHYQQQQDDQRAPEGADYAGLVNSSHKISIAHRSFIQRVFK